MSERINSNKEANIAQKVTKSVELIAIKGDYNTFETTEEFVQALSKHLKIIKICDSEHLTDCWPTRTITTPKGEKYNVSDAKTGQQLHLDNTTNNVGLILGDGTPLIMTYNPEANTVSGEGGFIASKKSLPIGGGKTKEFAYTSNATGAIDFVMDVNGDGGPNHEPDDKGIYDIRSFRAASFSLRCTGFKVGGTCIVNIGTDYTPLNCVDDNNPTYCITPRSNQAFDYQAGAKKACMDRGMRLPNRNELTGFLSLNDEKVTNLPNGLYVHSDRYGDYVNMVPKPVDNKWHNESPTSQRKLLCIGD